MGEGQKPGLSEEERRGFIGQWKNYLANFHSPVVHEVLFEYLVLGNKKDLGHITFVFDKDRLYSTREEMKKVKEEIFSNPNYAKFLLPIAEEVFPDEWEKYKNKLEPTSEHDSDISSASRLGAEQTVVDRGAVMESWRIFLSPFTDSTARRMLFNFLVDGRVSDLRGTTKKSNAYSREENYFDQIEKAWQFVSGDNNSVYAGSLYKVGADLFPKEWKSAAYDRKNKARFFKVGDLQEYLDKNKKPSMEEVNEREKMRIQEARNKQNQEALKHFSEREVPYLWPNGIGSHLKQGPVGDCYLVTALDAIKHSDNALGLMGRIMFRERGTLWGVNLFDEDKAKAGDPNNGWVVVYVDERDAADDKLIRSGSLGDRILERAYARFEHARRGGKAGKTMALDVKLKDEYDRERDAALFEGGFPYRAIQSFLGPRYQKVSTYSYRDRNGGVNSGNMDAILFNIEKERNSFYFIGTKQLSDLPDKGGFFGGKKHPSWFVPRHAFRIEQVDTKSGVCLLRNPHDTSKPVVVPIDELKMYAREIYGVVKKTEDPTIGGLHTRLV